MSDKSKMSYVGKVGKGTHLAYTAHTLLLVLQFARIAVAISALADLVQIELFRLVLLLVLHRKLALALSLRLHARVSVRGDRCVAGVE